MGHGPARARVLRYLLVSGIALWSSLTLATGSVTAQDGTCSVFVDRRNIDQASSPSSPISLPSDRAVPIRAESTAAIQDFDLHLYFGPVPLTQLSPADPPMTREWSGSVEVGDYATYGTGLYQVVGQIDGCPVNGWVRVLGGSPFTTVASIAAFVALAIGSVAAGTGLLSALRRGGGLIRSIIGGALIGASALVLAQQNGAAPADTGSIVGWTTIPGAAGGMSHVLLGAIVAPIRRRPGAGTGPATSAPEAAWAPRGPGPEPAPPRKTYAHIACPEIVVAEVEFELAVGVGARPDDAVVGVPLILPETVIGAYTMTIQVVADGFRLTRPGESWRVDLRVTGEAPYPVAVLHLAGDPQAAAVVARTIRAMYSVEGQAIGLAARPIAVVREARLLAETEKPPAAAPLDIQLPTDQAPPDLTVRIQTSEPPGRLLLQLLAADPSVPLPDDPLEIDVGLEPDLFLRDVITKMNAVEGQPGMYSRLMGIGLTIADELPAAFWAALAEVAARVDGPPTVLFLSDEPYIPWELAVMEQPLDDSLPPFLSAQAAVGRWILGQRYPKLPPPSQLSVSSMAVVSGIYQLPSWQRLYEAEEEAKDIARRFGAAQVDANAQDVLWLLSGQPAAEIMHFAAHGKYDPNGEIDGLVLADGTTLDEMQVKGSRLDRRPFVFLNACQVGSGNAVLGNYAGLAQAFLYAGASGVIAPLWSIDDLTARQIAIRFYTQALAGKTPAEILREERATFQREPNVASSTYLAYQFFGHPHLKLGADTEPAGGAS